MTLYPVDQAVELHTAAMALHAEGRVRDALGPCRQAVSILERECGENHPDLAAVLLALGRLHEDLGDLADAGAAYRRADDILDRYARERDPVLVRLRVRARARNGAVATAEGRLAQAELLFLQAIELAARELGAEDPVLIAAFNGLGVVCRRLGRFDDAERVHRRALVLAESALDANGLEVADICHNLAVLALTRGRYGTGLSFAERASVIRATALGEGHPSVGLAVMTLAGLHQGAGRLEEARRLLEQSLTSFERSLERHEWPLRQCEQALRECLHRLGEVAAELGDAAAAEAYYRRALAVAEGSEVVAAASTWRSLGVLLAERGDVDQGVALLYRAHDVFEDAFGPADPQTVATAADLARFVH